MGNSCNYCEQYTRIKERGALPMIDRGDIRQAIDRCS
ncbi:Lysozyme, partial [Bacillus thuringiensis Sbt003]